VLIKIVLEVLPLEALEDSLIGFSAAGGAEATTFYFLILSLEERVALSSESDDAGGLSFLFLYLFSFSAPSSAGFSEPLSASASSFSSSTRRVSTFYIFFFFFLGGLRQSKSGMAATILLSTTKPVSSLKIS
jgi:hypothetical protein